MHACMREHFWGCIIILHGEKSGRDFSNYYTTIIHRSPVCMCFFYYYYFFNSVYIGLHVKQNMPVLRLLEIQHQPPFFAVWSTPIEGLLQINTRSSVGGWSNRHTIVIDKASLVFIFIAESHKSCPYWLHHLHSGHLVFLYQSFLNGILRLYD